MNKLLVFLPIMVVADCQAVVIAEEPFQSRSQIKFELETNKEFSNPVAVL